MSARPRSVRLRAYAVGSGDCLLVTVGYGSALPDGRRVRHMLVDFGDAGPTNDQPSLADVASAVAEHCEGRLDVVVATRPRPGHAGGFDDPTVREILRPLRPAVVVRPWLDAPDPQTVPGTGSAPAIDALVATMKERTDTATDPTLLDDWGRAGRTAYVQAGEALVLDAELPRVTVEVLGPPGPSRVHELVGVGERFFALATEAARPASSTPVADAWADALTRLAEPDGAGAAERLLRSVRRKPVSPEMEIADDAAGVACDTSVIVLLTVGNRRLLLPGDARTAGWAPVLDRAWGAPGVPKDPDLADRLAEVDLYRVGRHGERGATPLRLRDLWHRRPGSARPVVSVLSGGPQTDPALVADLERLGSVYRTDALPHGAWWRDVECPTSGRGPVTTAVGPATPGSGDVR